MSGISRKTATLGVIACIVLALALRLCALDARLPCDLEPDGGIIAGQVAMIHSAGPNRDAVFVWRLYPHLVAELTALLPERVQENNSLAEHLAQASAPFVRVRLVVALLSLLGIPATYWLARRFLSRGPALLATFLSATSLLTLNFAQQARPHAPAAAFALLAVVAALRLARRPNWISCSLAGVALGLSVGALQSGAAAALPIGAAWLWRKRERNDCAQRWLAPVWIGLLAGGIAYALYPHALPSSAVEPGGGSAFAGLSFMSGASDPSAPGGVGHGIRLDLFDGTGFSTVAQSLLSFETLPLLTALLSLLIGLKSLIAREPLQTNRRDFFVVTSYALPYLLMIGLYGLTYERFCLQLVPFLCCLAAAAWGWTASRVKRSLAIALLLVLAVPELAACLALERLRLREDSPTLLARWIEAHVAPASERVLFLPGVDVPLARTQEALGMDSTAGFGTPWMDYQRRNMASRWDCPKFFLAHAPLLRAPDFALALKDPLTPVRASNANLVALIVPAPDLLHTVATQIAAAVQSALTPTATREYRVPGGPNTQPVEPALNYNFHSGNTIWTFELLCGLSSIGPTLELLRLP